MGDIVIVGAGGTASHLVGPLMKMSDTELVHIWDEDTVEEDNLIRQMFDYTDVGQPKATTYQNKWGNAIVPHLEYVGEDNIGRVIQDTDIVFICADNMAVRQVIDTHAATLPNVTIINGGNEMHSGSTQLHIRVHGRNITPRISYHSPEILMQSHDLSTMSCAQIALLPGGEQTMLANMTVAALMLQAFERSRTREWMSPDKQWTKMTFDIVTGLWQGSDVRIQGDDWA